MRSQGTIYIDSVFLLNLVMDLYLLRLTAKIRGKTATVLRCFAGSLIGAFGYCLPLICLPKAPFWWKSMIFMLPAQALMIRIVFGAGSLREHARSMGWMLTLSFLLGGFMLFLKGRLPFGRESTFMLIGLGTVGYAAIQKGICLYREKKQSYFCRVILTTDSGPREITALIDTGNGLKEPVSQKPVAILDEGIWEDMKMWRKPERYKIIPYHSIGRSRGVLEAYEVESIRVSAEKEEKKYEKVIIALHKGNVSGKGSYQMILPPELSI